MQMKITSILLNRLHSVEEYDLALNISQIDSKTPNNNLLDDMLVLKNLRVSYPNNIIIGHLNINCDGAMLEIYLDHKFQ